MATRTISQTASQSEAAAAAVAAPSSPVSSRRKTKPWRHRMHSFGAQSQGSLAQGGSQERLSIDASRASTISTRKRKWWQIRLFRGMINDVRRRAPYYKSDWVDAWDYRVVPSTVYMYFANILPALAFSLDMFTKTGASFGVNEVLLASVLGSVVFAFLAAQPLVIVGVTGPITVFNYTVYDIVKPAGIDYFAFMCWIGLWSMVMHWILAITNACNWLTYVTRFSCDTFGFYVAFIYLQKGIQVLSMQWEQSETGAYLSIMVALLVMMIAYLCGVLGESTLLNRHVRKFVEDYGTPLTVVFFTGFVHIGLMQSVSLQTLPTSTSFLPTPDRSWLVEFWKLGVGEVFLAVPFAVLLTVLFWFDHNVSSLIAQGTEFPLRKPAGFHWDIFLLGLTTGVAGILGIPFPNGLIPQAPFHTASLCVTRQVAVSDDSGVKRGEVERVTDHVVEQRFSNLAQGLLTLGTMTSPLLVVLHLIPQGVLAGLFFIMGLQALQANGITRKLVYLLSDASLVSSTHPLRAMSAWRVGAFVALEILGFGATFAITQTIAAIGFPVFILALIPVRASLLPRWFSPAELALLDAPTASPFTMESVGGAVVGASPPDVLPVTTPHSEVTTDRGSDSEDSVVSDRDHDDDDAIEPVPAQSSTSKQHLNRPANQTEGVRRRSSFRPSEPRPDAIELVDRNPDRRGAAPTPAAQERPDLGALQEQLETAGSKRRSK